MLEEYKEEQPIFYNIVVNSMRSNKLSHAYLIEANDNPHVLDIVMSFVKSIICPHNYVNNKKCLDCNLCNRINNGNYLELKVIQPDGLWIKKDQMLMLQEEFSKVALEGNKKIYIILDSDKMNKATANSILKFLEEPNPNIIAILIANNRNQLLETIVSRCQIIGLNKKKEEDQGVINNLATLMCTSDKEIKTFINDKGNVELITSVLDFIKYYEKNGIDTLIYTKKIWHSKIKDKEKNIMAIDLMINFYYDVLKYKSNNEITFFKENELLIKDISGQATEKIINKLEILLESRELVKYNININLLIDKMIIDFGGK